MLINEVLILVRELIDSFDPGVIAINAISKYQQTSPFLKQMRLILKREAAISQVVFIEITLNQIISILCSDEKSTQKEAFRQLAHSYPELIHFINLPNQWQNQYYNNLLMAVSVGVVFLRTQNQKDL